LVRVALLVGAVGIVAGATVQGVFGLWQNGWDVPRTVVQPFPFNHKVHTAKADCVLCHRGARDGVHAGLPQLDFCTGCHTRAPLGQRHDPALEQIWSSVERGEAPTWNRYFAVPEHVYFSHRRHVRIAKLECKTCHGDMQEHERPPPIATAKLRMAICVNCHNREQVSVDCTTCHR
jgi:hypothetical protein